MLELRPSLTTAARAALADLERRTVAADGGRLKLEWGVLAAQSGADVGVVNDVLWWDGSRLAGFLGLYAFGGGSTVELVGMVDPSDRRRGIGTALLSAALDVCRERGFAEVLLVAPRNEAGGREFAAAHGGVLEHSEHAMVLRGEPADGPVDPAVTLQLADASDATDISRLLGAAFGRVPDRLEDVIEAGPARTLVIRHAGDVVGTVRLTQDAAVGGIYGFVVDPAWQGRGIGRDVLRRCCRMLRNDGASSVGLEVEVDNERALGLYTSVGFERVLTEDYYALPS